LTTGDERCYNNKEFDILSKAEAIRFSPYNAPAVDEVIELNF